MQRHDLHTHSDYSDGMATVEGLVARANELRLEVLAITDHFWPSLGAQNRRGLTQQRRRIINELRGEYDLLVLDGAEVDLYPDGTIAPVNGGYEQFDLIIGSMHLCVDSREWANAIVTIAQMGVIDILGHFDGYLNSYDPVDGERVASALAENNVSIELSARYGVQYMKFIERARDMGCTFTLGSDAHSIDGVGRLKKQRDLAHALGLEVVAIPETPTL